MKPSRRVAQAFRVLGRLQEVRWMLKVRIAVLPFF